jgi:hypothetical protein
MLGVRFRSVTATRARLPRVLVGALREVTVTIHGKSADYVLERHRGAWLANMMISGAHTHLVQGNTRTRTSKPSHDLALSVLAYGFLSYVL